MSLIIFIRFQLFYLRKTYSLSSSETEEEERKYCKQWSIELTNFCMVGIYSL